MTSNFVSTSSRRIWHTIGCISLCHGTLESELVCFLADCNDKLGIHQKHLRQFFAAAWKFPACKDKARLDLLFEDSGEAFHGWRGTASQLLDALPILRHFVIIVVQVTSQLEGQCKSFLLLCDAVDRIVELKRSNVCSLGQTVELSNKLSEHLELFVAMYGEECTKPKHHYSVHMPLQFRRDGFVLDAFVAERKHRTLKTILHQHKLPAELPAMPPLPSS